MQRFGKKGSLWVGLIAIALLGAAPGRDVGAVELKGDEPVVGLPCEGCEAIFDGLPATLASTSRIAPAEEPGEPLRIEGTVTRENGAVAAGIVVYAYHTDAKGIYPSDGLVPGRAGSRHGRLRGWARSDERGRYAFETIRPGGYPGSTIPQHVHMHVLEPGSCTYYIDDIVFADDPRLTAAARDQYAHGRGGSGLATPRRGADGVWIVERNIVLGRGVEGHPGAGAEGP